MPSHQAPPSTVAFLALTFALSWLAWLGAAAAGFPAGSSAFLGGFLYFVGVFAPAIVALALTAQARGAGGVRALLGQLATWPSQARWFVFALAFMAAIKLSAALVLRIGTGEWPAFGSEAVWLMALAIPLSTPVQAGEEIGWRGFALPALAARFGLGGASVLLGIVWAFWHLPFFFMPGADKAGQSFPMYLLSVVALSVAMAWLYWRTGRSLLLVMLLHAAVNNTTNLVPAALPGASEPFSFAASRVAWTTTALLWIFAAVFLARMRGATLGEDGDTPGLDPRSRALSAS